MMQPIINTKTRFYDYFPHINVMRMKTDFGMGYYEQSVIRHRIQAVIAASYNRMLDKHDLRHVNVYNEIGEEFDDNFYRELRQTVQLQFHDMGTWAFLDDLMPYQEIEDENANRNFQTKMTATLGVPLPRSQTTGRIMLKDALVTLLNYDLDPLSGQELQQLSKLN